MFRIGEQLEDNNPPEENLMDLPVFGGFEPDDPDFIDQENNGFHTTPPRPRSRVSSRNSSSSSLRRNASSNNSLVRFYLGTTTTERHPSGLSVSTKSSLESLSRDIELFQPQDGYLPVFGFRQQLQLEQCYSCCVNWDQDQFSFDCIECGGYAIERDCPECGGVCNSKWKRDFNASHIGRRAAWIGTCLLSNRNSNQSNSVEEDGRISDARTLDGSEHVDETLLQRLEKL